MITSKERADLRSQANTLEVTLIVGKGGVSDTLISEAEKLLDDHELVKGKVLESSFLTAREASDAICEATGADGIQCVGSKFVIWRKSEKPEAKNKEKPVKAVKVKQKNGKDNPVKAGIHARKTAARAKREQQKKYYHDAAVKAAIEKRKQSQG